MVRISLVRSLSGPRLEFSSAGRMQSTWYILFIQDYHPPCYTSHLKCYSNNYLQCVLPRHFYLQTGIFYLQIKAAAADPADARAPSSVWCAYHPSALRNDTWVEKQAFTAFDQPVIILHIFTILHLWLVFALSDIIPKAVNGAGFHSGNYKDTCIIN